MKIKFLIALLASCLVSTATFAGVWRGDAYYAPHHRYWHSRPYVGAYIAPYVAPVPYAVPTPYIDGYAGPAPYYGAVWCPGRWAYGPSGRYWVRGYWRHRR